MPLDHFTSSLSITGDGLFAATVLAIASLTDIRAHRIYNKLTYPTALIGIAWSCLPISGLSLTQSLIGCVGCGLLMLLPYTLSGGGAGDVKLAMAVGSLAGFDATLQGFCAGYLIATIFIVLRYLVAQILCVTGESLSPIKLNANAPVPLAGFFAGGMLNAYLLGPLW